MQLMYLHLPTKFKQDKMKLFSEYKLGDVTLKNRIVMAPMTRSRAINNIPNDIMAQYYAMRADGGLLITEGIAPSPNGLGYPRIPGLFNQEQVDGWKKVTDAVHDNGGVISAQLMHTGRIGHPLNMSEGGEVVGPSAIVAKGQMYTDQEGPQDHPTPKEMTLEDIEQAQNEYVTAAKNAIEAGFDFVELHGANGYLIDQFINPGANQRTDDYGGSIENRSRFAIETAKKVADAIGANKTAIRLSPHGAFNDLFPFEGTDEQFTYIAQELGKLNLAYLHIVDHSAMGAPEVPETLKEAMKAGFGNTIIYSGGYDKQSAEERLQKNDDLVAFGKPYLANPDLVTRMEKDAELNQPDFDTFYTSGEKGYIDYPTLAQSN